MTFYATRFVKPNESIWDALEDLLQKEGASVVEAAGRRQVIRLRTGELRTCRLRSDQRDDWWVFPDPDWWVSSDPR